MASSVEFASVAAGLFALRPQGPRFGIERMRALVAELGHPERATPWVHVAGTNGKGSVSAMMESILRAAGWRTGLFTSPHLVHVGERVQVNRVPLSEEEIIHFVAELRPVADRVAARAPELRPSFFEFMTAMAFLQFAREKCDVAVLEVGLGGRLDATNAVQPVVCAITSIGLDHCELLGAELEQIAAEKAGIIKPGVPVVVGRMPRPAEKIIRATAAQVGAPLVSVAERFGDSVDALPRTNLEGDYQRWNAATAVLVAQALGPRWRITPKAISQGLEHVDWSGRWQRIRVGGRQVILDASHNPEGAGALADNLRRLGDETGRAPVVVAGVLGLARAKSLVDAICLHASEVHFVVPSEPRACSHDDLVALVPETFAGALVRTTIDALFPSPDRCTAGRTGDPVVVTGSIQLVGEVMRRLQLSP